MAKITVSSEKVAVRVSLEVGISAVYITYRRGSSNAALRDLNCYGFSFTGGVAKLYLEAVLVIIGFHDPNELGG